jgi:hypothetical protein
VAVELAAEFRSAQWAGELHGGGKAEGLGAVAAVGQEWAIPDEGGEGKEAVAGEAGEGIKEEVGAFFRDEAAYEYEGGRARGIGG